MSKRYPQHPPQYARDAPAQQRLREGESVAQDGLQQRRQGLVAHPQLGEVVPRLVAVVTSGGDRRITVALKSGGDSSGDTGGDGWSESGDGGGGGDQNGNSGGYRWKEKTRR